MASDLVATVSLMSVAIPTGPGTRVADRVCCVGTPRLSVLVVAKGPERWPANATSRTLHTRIFPQYVTFTRVGYGMPYLPNLWGE